MNLSHTPNDNPLRSDHYNNRQSAGYQNLRPKINIDMKQFEIELIDENDPSVSKLTFSMIGISGYENKKIKKSQIVFENISFKVFECYLVKGIELKY